MHLVRGEVEIAKQLEDVRVPAGNEPLATYPASSSKYGSCASCQGCLAPRLVNVQGTPKPVRLLQRRRWQNAIRESEQNLSLTPRREASIVSEVTGKAAVGRLLAPDRDCWLVACHRPPV